MRRTLLSISLALGGSACADLDRLEEGACGNAVVEAEVGEDCDTFTDDSLGAGLECGAPQSAAQACRYLCDGARCPIGWSCGDDGICRAHSGLFEDEDEPVLAVSADQILVGDFFDDEQEEIVTRRGGDLTVYANEDDELARDSELTLPNARSEAFAFDVDGDGLVDVVQAGLQRPLDAGASRALHALRRGRERLQTAVLPRTGAAGLGLTGVTRLHRVVRAPAQPGAGGDVPVVVGERDAELLAFVPEPSCPVVAEGAIATLGDASGRMAFDPVAISVEADEVWTLFPVDDESVLRVATLTRECGDGACPAATGDSACATSLALGSSLEFGMRVRAPGCAAWDADGDGTRDVVCHGPNGRLRAAPGAGAGLGAAVELTEAFAGREILPASQPRSCDEGHAVLAAADLDADGLVDVVTPHGVFLRTADGLDRAYARQRGDAWGDAVIGDFDGDGALEVVASVRSADAGCDATQLERLIQTDGTFTASLVPDAPPPTALSVGDFDGDGIDDVAASGRLGGDSRRVVVFYGDTKEALEDVAVVGEVEGLSVLTSLRSRVGTEINDELLSDVFVVSGEGAAWSLATGTTDRTMLAPLHLPLGEGAELSDGVLIALAGDLVPRPGGEAPDDEEDDGDEEHGADDADPSDLLVLADDHAWLQRRESQSDAGALTVLVADEIPAALRRIQLSCARFTVAPRGSAGALILGVGPVGAGAQPPDCEGPHELTIASIAEDGRTALRAHNRLLPADVRGVGSLHALDFGPPGDSPDALVLAERASEGSGSALFLFDDLAADPDAGAADPRDLLAGAQVLAVAPVNADRDRDLEIAALTPAGLVIIDRRLEDDEETITVHDEAMASPLAGLESAGVVQLVTGRIDEDDLDDLTVLAGESIYVLPGVPVR